MIPKSIKPDKIDSILTDDIISTKDGGAHRYLVQWSRCLASDDSRITHDKLQHLDPELLLEYYLSSSDPNSTGSSSSHQTLDSRSLTR